MSDADLDRLLATALLSSSPARTIVAGPHEPAASTSAEETFERLLARATHRLGAPAFDDRSDRASIDTWDPGARRLAAWPHADGLVFIAMEQDEAGAAVLVVSSRGDPGGEVTTVLANRSAARPGGWVTLDDLGACLQP